MNNQDTSLFRFHRGYALLTLILFITEVLIALYVHDNFLRPYGGDYLVVILLYCFIQTLLKLDIRLTALIVLLISYFIEYLQYLNFVERVGLMHIELARIVIGTSFHWYDMLAYTLGILSVMWVEFKMIKKKLEV